MAAIVVTNITINEAEKSAQAPLAFENAVLEYFIDEDPADNLSCGGSGSGNTVHVSSEPSIAMVDPNTGFITLLDDGIATINATKAGDDVYQATSAYYQLKVMKYNRSDFQNITFEFETLNVDLEASQHPGNLFLPTSNTPNQTREVKLSFNLPADSTPLDPGNFVTDNVLTYNVSFSMLIYDSFGRAHLQTFYFVKDSNVFRASSEWLVTTAIDDVQFSIFAMGMALTRRCPPVIALVHILEQPGCRGYRV